jgi:hypothetical protein
LLSKLGNPPIFAASREASDNTRQLRDSHETKTHKEKVMTTHPNKTSRRRCWTRLLLAGTLAGSLVMHAVTAAAVTADDLLNELDFVELWTGALDFDRDRWANPPDHAVARSIASFPLCASTGVTGMLFGDAGINFIPQGKGIIDPSLKLTAKVAAELSVSSSSKLAWDGSQGVSLRLCINLFPWFQFAYYEASGKSVAGDDWKAPNGGQGNKYSQAMQSSPFYASLSADAKAFLESGYQLMYGDAANGTFDEPKKLGEIELIRSLINDAGDLLDVGADGVVSAIDAMGTVLNSGAFLVDGTSGNPLDELQTLALNMEAVLPIGQSVSSAVHTVQNSTMELLDPCQIVTAGAALQTILPTAFTSHLDTACGGVRQFTDFGGDVLQAGLDSGADPVALAGATSDLHHTLNAFSDALGDAPNEVSDILSPEIWLSSQAWQSAIDKLSPITQMVNNAIQEVSDLLDDVGDLMDGI